MDPEMVVGSPLGKCVWTPPLELLGVLFLALQLWLPGLRAAVEAVLSVFRAPRPLPRTVKRRRAREKEKQDRLEKRLRNATGLGRTSTGLVEQYRPRVARCTSVVDASADTVGALSRHRQGTFSDCRDTTCDLSGTSLQAGGHTILNIVDYIVCLGSDRPSSFCQHDTGNLSPCPSRRSSRRTCPQRATGDGTLLAEPAAPDDAAHPPKHAPQIVESTRCRLTNTALSHPVQRLNKDKGLDAIRSQWISIDITVWTIEILGFGGGGSGLPPNDLPQLLAGSAKKGNGNRRNANGKKGTGDKRKRNHGDGDDDDDDGDKKRGGPGCHRNDDEGEWDGRLLGCPFYKLDPHHYSRCLAKYELRRFADVKQHLIRCHKVKGYYCSRCLREEEDLATWEAHSLACEEPILASGPESLTVDEIERLKDVPRGADKEEKYFWVWNQYFSGHPAPASPYVQKYMDETREVHAPDFQAALSVSLASSNYDMGRRQGEDRGAHAHRVSGHLGPRMLELARQATHSRRFRNPASAVASQAPAPAPAPAQGQQPPADQQADAPPLQDQAQQTTVMVAPGRAPPSGPQQQQLLLQRRAQRTTAGAMRPMPGTAAQAAAANMMASRGATAAAAPGFPPRARNMNMGMTANANMNTRMNMNMYMDPTNLGMVPNNNNLLHFPQHPQTQGYGRGYGHPHQLPANPAQDPEIPIDPALRPVPPEEPQDAPAHTPAQHGNGFDLDNFDLDAFLADNPEWFN